MALRMRETGRSLVSLARGATPAHLHLRDRLMVLWVISVTLDLIFSAGAYVLEVGKPGSGLTSYGDALFWTTTQLLTVSSQLPNPVTTGGKFLDVAMEFVGMTLITAQAGSLGSFLYRRSLERHPMT